MPPKPRQVRVESKNAMAAMQQLETRSDEELEKETRFKAAAQAILGTRAAERMDADKARQHFKVAIASARPQERMQLRRMAEASMALAERRAGDLKVAAERMGAPVPTNRQLWMLRIMGVIQPPRNAPMWRRIAGPLLLLLAIVAVICLGFLVVTLVALPFGGVGSYAWLYGFILVLAVIGVLVWRGRKRQAAARAKAAEQRAATFGGKQR
jgi:hypothetical protein